MTHPKIGVRVTTKKGKDMFKYKDGRWGDVLSETDMEITVETNEIRMLPDLGVYREYHMVIAETNERVQHTIPKMYVEDARR